MVANRNVSLADNNVRNAQVIRYHRAQNTYTTLRRGIKAAVFCVLVRDDGKRQNRKDTAFTDVYVKSVSFDFASKQIASQVY